MSKDDFDRLPILLRPSEVQEILNISESTWKKLANENALPTIKIPGMKERRISKFEIRRLISGLQVNPVNHD